VLLELWLIPSQGGINPVTEGDTCVAEL